MQINIITRPEFVLNKYSLSICFVDQHTKPRRTFGDSLVRTRFFAGEIIEIV